MYEVDFDIVAGTFTRLFNLAGVSEYGNIARVNGGIWNALGTAPRRPGSVQLGWGQTARGPVPGTPQFAVQAITLTFPAYIVDAGNAAGSRHFLTTDVTNFFEAYVDLVRRRADLAVQATFGMQVRRLFQENDPADDRNQANAARLYSAVDHYPRCLCVDAGGDESGYTMSFDIYQHAKRTRVDNYGGGGSGGGLDPRRNNRLGR